MPVGRLLAEMSARELAEWIAFMKHEKMFKGDVFPRLLPGRAAEDEAAKEGAGVVFETLTGAG